MMPFTFRHLEPDADLSRLAKLQAEVEAADQDGRDVSPTRLREQMAIPGHDAVQDCWVVEPADDPEHIIAFCGVWKATNDDHADISGIVHPQWRRKGIGRILLSRTLVRARNLGARQVDAYVNAQNKPGNAFLHEHSFLPVSAYTLMRADNTVQFEMPVWPAGFTVRSFDAVLDVSVLVKAMNDSYDGLWGHNPVTEEEIGKQLKERPAEGIFLAFDAGGEVAGVSSAEMSRKLSAQRGEPTGRLDAPGVIPWRRRHGLYLPLLLTGVHYLLAQQPAAIELESWGDDDRVLAEYEQAGFTVVRRSVPYRLNLR